MQIPPKILDCFQFRRFHNRLDVKGSPQSMSRLEWNKIAIWENKQRIKELQFFRDVYLLGLWGYMGMLISEASGKPFTPEERGGIARLTELSHLAFCVRSTPKLATQQDGPSEITHCYGGCDI